jgi:hypothetical protein
VSCINLCSHKTFKLMQSSRPVVELNFMGYASLSQIGEYSLPLFPWYQHTSHELNLPP